MFETDKICLFLCETFIGNKMNHQIAYSPTKPSERIIQIDILRGFALFGVLLVNVFGYHSSFFDFSGFYASFTDPLNSSVFNLLIGYGADKFIFIFSLLFGMGFSMMYAKYRSNESYFFPLYLRRLLILMAFGIIHIVFFWAGDILFSYSLMGIILLLSRKLNSHILLFLSVFLYFLPIGYIALESIFPFLPSALSSVTDIQLPEVIEIYSKGSFQEIFNLRITEYWAFRNINLIYYAPKVLSLFIFGYLFHKHHFIKKINSSVTKYFIMALVLLAFGIILTINTNSIVDTIAQSNTNPLYTAIYMAVFEVSNIFLGFSYTILILVLSQISFTKTLLNPLQYVGRMALTNYLMQSLIFTSLMYSYGFGLFGNLQPWQLVLLAIVVYIFQIIFSKLWLKYYRFGPMEWLWRKGSYSGKIT